MKDDIAGQTVLITGASSGIGKELARVFAREGCKLILVARNRDKLEALAEFLDPDKEGRVHVLTSDLSDEDSARKLYESLPEEAPHVDILVNNAGVGWNGAFVEQDSQDLHRMISLNVLSLSLLTRFLLPSMLERGRGRILNVASTAAFQPGPQMAAYYATKAYVLSLSEALTEEMRGKGITVTALCPGPTRSAFADRAGMSDVPLFRFFSMPADRVAETGFRALMRGRPIVIPGLFNRLFAFCVRLTPRSVVRRVVRLLQEKRN